MRVSESKGTQSSSFNEEVVGKSGYRCDIQMEQGDLYYYYFLAAIPFYME